MCYTYNIEDGDFSSWLNLRSGCKTLLLQGKVHPVEHLEKLQTIEEAILSKRILIVDISGLDFTGFDWTTLYDSDTDADLLPVLNRMVQNRNYATEFMWQGDSLTSSDGRTLVYHKPMKKEAIPEQVKIIGKSAFSGQTALEEVVLPCNVEVIDDNAFADCYSLSKIVFPSSIKHIGDWAFADCGLLELDIPNGLETISTGCFSGNLFSNIQIPGSVKKVCEFAFDDCMGEVWIADGVKTIEAHSFGNIRFLHVPASLTEISRDFYLNQDGVGEIPFVDVNPDNPVFYDIKGTLYKKGEDSPYLGEEFIPEVKKTLLNPSSTFSYERTYSLEELQEHYYSVCPIDSKQQLFHVWNGTERYFNIVDRHGNEYFDKSLVEDVIFSFDHFVIVNHSAVYSIDMKELLMDASLLEYDITACDPDGRIYVMKDYDVDDAYPPFWGKDSLPQFWCIDVYGRPLLTNKYNGLQPFDAKGLAPAAVGKLWGMIDTDENVIIPFEYKKVGYFDSSGMSLVEKGQMKGYVNQMGEIVIPLCYNFFYKEFEQDDYAYAMIYKGKNKGEYFINRQGHVLGKFQPSDKFEQIYSPGFHLFRLGERYGYCRQFAREFSGCVFKDIKKISDTCIEASTDGVMYSREVL